MNIISKIQNIKRYILLSQTVNHVLLHIRYRPVLHYENCEMSTRLPSTGVAVAKRGRLGAYILPQIINEYSTLIHACIFSQSHGWYMMWRRY